MTLILFWIFGAFAFCCGWALRSIWYEANREDFARDAEALAKLSSSEVRSDNPHGNK